MDQRWKQQWGVTPQNALLPGSSEVGKLRDRDGAWKVVSHDDNRIIPFIKKILDAQ